MGAEASKQADTTSPIDNDDNNKGDTDARMPFPADGAEIRIRKASADDLPAIHALIMTSFEAMIPHSWFFASFWRNAATELITSELAPENFEKAYFIDEKDNYFWVAEAVTGKDSEGNYQAQIVGCVGVKRENADDQSQAELVRMSVSEVCRGRGVGRLLFNELLAHCESKKRIKKIVLGTGNPDSVKFYEKIGFTIIPHWMYWTAEYNLVDTSS
jgi:N-acetylglutamate synthase-like GNAT family acetyltransferase